jgi:hypothetical protein
LVESSHQLGADAPNVDPGALFAKTVDDVFVEVVARDNLCVRKPRLIQQPARGDAQAREVSRVQSDPRKLVTLFPKFFRDFDGMPDSLMSVVSVDQKDRIRRHGFGESSERFQF